MRTPSLGFALWSLVGGVLGLSIACGTEAPQTVFVEPAPTEPPVEDSLGTPGNFPAQQAKCEGLGCKQVECGGSVSTTLTGVVHAPNGTLPLYNAIVYVPTEPLEPIADGASCDRCGHVSGKPLVSAITNVEGKFELRNVPVGDNIPLVVQIGKWRRQVVVPKVTACKETAVDNDLTRLPKNRKEGDIPRIAVTTGRCDQLACLLPKLGLDESEYSDSDGEGRLHLYRGASHPRSNPIKAPAPDGTADSTELYTPDRLKKYDMVLLSCECGEHDETKPAEAKKALYDYSASGGRVFASHFHYTWADTGALKSTAEWMGSEDNEENQPGPYLVDQSTAKGKAFAQWLVNVEATQTLGEIPISQPRENVGKVAKTTQRWVYRETGNASMPETTKYLSANTPVNKPAAEQCGKFVFADMHLYGQDVQPEKGALPDNGFPGTCSKDLRAEEKAMIFLFFELSSCVQDEQRPPTPPVK